MNEAPMIPPIRMAEVFVDGHCVGLLSDVKLSREDDGAFKLVGEWSGYSDVLRQESLFTISIPRYECRFLAEKVNEGKTMKSGRVTVSFNGASFIPDGPRTWFDTFTEGSAEA
jgi:hypothetical protein